MAEDGSLGPTSSGTSHISLVVPPRNEVVYTAGGYKIDTNMKPEDYTEVIVSTTSKNGETVIVVILQPKL